VCFEDHNDSRVLGKTQRYVSGYFLTHSNGASGTNAGSLLLPQAMGSPERERA
jgi:hypothetical protein